MKRKMFITFVLFLCFSDYCYAQLWGNAPSRLAETYLRSYNRSLNRNQQLQDEARRQKQYQEICQSYIVAIYKLAKHENISMPDLPNPPYSELQVQIYYKYLSEALQKKQQQNLLEKKEDDGIIKLVKDLKEEINNYLEAVDPLDFLIKLKDDIYYKSAMDYLKGNDKEAYKIVYTEYLSTLKIAKQIKNVDKKNNETSE